MPRKSELSSALRNLVAANDTSAQGFCNGRLEFLEASLDLSMKYQQQHTWCDTQHLFCITTMAKLNYLTIGPDIQKLIHEAATEPVKAYKRVGESAMSTHGVHFIRR